ncbi:MAG: ATP-binding protein [Gammaproteobacteria bacterium]|nr:ATP-binding protein [Gammaproteobacteria bacterium]
MDSNWRQQYVYNTKNIQQINPIPELVNSLKSLLPQISTSEITTILTELYNNSVDHGILNLSSDIKQQFGLEKFYQIRKQKLSDLTEGFVNLNLSYSSEDNLLTIQIEDSGQGFDYKKYTAMPLMLHKVSGKGLYIIHSLADKVEYTDSGNSMTVYYKVRSNEEIMQSTVQPAETKLSRVFQDRIT